MDPVGEDRPYNVFREASLPQYTRTLGGMLFRGGHHFPVEVVEQACDSPTVLVLPVLACIGPHSRLHRQQVLHQVLDPAGIRQDHVIMERTVDDSGAVTGAALHGSKIGGDIAGSHLFFADPMGATGSSLIRVIQHYREQVEGTPKVIISAHLIVTPEFIRALQAEVPDIRIWALRLDRGSSPADVLKMKPGQDLRESGLNEVDYIVPGAGGVGEIINNSWV